jgi:hypothetical protein
MIKTIAMYGSQPFHVIAIAVILLVILLCKAPSERKEDRRAGAVGTILLSPFFRGVSLVLPIPALTLTQEKYNAITEQNMFSFSPSRI